MKISADDIARSLIETCKGLTEGQCADVVDAAMETLRKHGLARAIRSFPRTVRRMMEKEGMVFAELTTPEENTDADAVAAILETVFKKKAALTRKTDPSLLGGAVLQVRDDRFDASVRGSLSRLQRSLSSSVPA